MKVTLFRMDFRKSQDHPHESLFEGVLSELRIPEERWDDIDSVELEVIDFEESE